MPNAERILAFTICWEAGVGRWFRRWGIVLVVVVLSCGGSTRPVEKKPTPFVVEEEADLDVWWATTIMRFRDTERGVVCWVSRAPSGTGISCLPESEVTHAR